jgi:hypothetical protein
MTDLERDELLIELQTDVKWLIKSQDNHLQHHFRYTLAAWGVALAAIIGLIITVIKGI